MSEKDKSPERVIVLGNLDFKNTKKDVCIKIPKLNKCDKVDIIHGDGSLKIHKRKLITELTPGEIEVVKISN